jgi:hypothetical protein
LYRYFASLFFVAVSFVCTPSFDDKRYAAVYQSTVKKHEKREKNYRHALCQHEQLEARKK